MLHLLRPCGRLAKFTLLERDESRFVPPLDQSPFIPAKAGIQGPRTQPSTGSPLPRGRAELRGDPNSSHLALGSSTPTASTRTARPRCRVARNRRARYHPFPPTPAG